MIELSMDIPARGSRKIVTLWGVAAWLCVAVIVSIALTIAQRLDVGSGSIDPALRLLIPFGSWALLFPFVGFMVRRFPLRRGRFLQSLAVHAPTAAICAVLIECVCQLFTFCCAGRTSVAPAIANDLFVYFALLCTSFAGNALDEIQQSERRRAARERELGRASFRAYRSLLPEWFLSGTFDSLRKQIQEAGDAGEALLLRFAEFLRALVQAAAAGSWELEREIGLIALYADVEAARAGTTTGVTVDAEEDVLLEPVPAGDLQNQVLQSLQGRNEPWKGMIRIRAERDDQRQVITAQLAVPGRSPLRLEVPLQRAQGGRIAEPEPGRPPVSLRAYTLGVVLAAAVVSFATQFVHQHAQHGPTGLGFLLVIGFRFAMNMTIAITAGMFLRKLAPSGPKRILIYVAGATLCAGMGELAFFILLHLANISFSPPFSPRLMVSLALTSLGPTLILSFAVLMALEDILLRHEHHTREVRALELGRQASVAQLELLRGQLHPHFLFNALNSLAALLKKDRAAAVRMLDRLRAFCVRADSFEDRPVIDLAEELELIGEYIAIERVRFGARLVIELDVDPSAESAAIPTLLLQPLVENAIKHGTRQGGLSRILIRVRRAQAEVLMTIENRGAPGISETKGTGLGLRNCGERLERMFGRRASLNAVRKPDGTATVTLRIPFMPLELGGAGFSRAV